MVVKQSVYFREAVSKDIVVAVDLIGLQEAFQGLCQVHLPVRKVALVVCEVEVCESDVHDQSLLLESCLFGLLVVELGVEQSFLSVLQV